MKNLAYFSTVYGTAHLTFTNWEGVAELDGLVTCSARPGRYVRVYDGDQYRQLCEGGGRLGPTLSWAPKEEDLGSYFAECCNAKLYKTFTGYAEAILKSHGKRVSKTDKNRWAILDYRDMGEVVVTEVTQDGFRTRREAQIAALEEIGFRQS